MPGASDNWDTSLPSVEQYALQAPNSYGNNLWGPPQQPPQVMSNISDFVNNAITAFDPSQGIPYMISQQPGMQNRPLTNDLTAAIWGMLTPGNETGKMTRNLSELPISRSQMETNALSSPNRGGLFFSTGKQNKPGSGNFYSHDAESLARYRNQIPDMFLEGGNVPVTATLNVKNPLMPVVGNGSVEGLLPRLIGEDAYQEVSGLDRNKNRDKYYQVLGKYGINKKEADNIPDAPWAVSERVLAEVARKQGYDTVIAQPRVTNRAWAEKNLSKPSNLISAPDEVFALKPYRGYQYPIKNVQFGQPK